MPALTSWLAKLPAGVTGVRHDSRAIGPGDVFVALRGQAHDGRRFVSDAVRRGAVAVITEEPIRCDVDVVCVPDARRALAEAAHFVYGHPSRSLQVVGITGTNGKTTTASMLSHALWATGHDAAVLGTLGLQRAASDGTPSSRIVAPRLNTPEADTLARLQRDLVADGVSHLVVEMTSHAIACHRVDAMRIAVAAFTNLSHDHLDLHGSLQAYAAAKRRLFEELEPERAVVMIDDDLGRSIRHRRCLTVSIHPGARADIRPRSSIQCSAEGSRCDVHTPAGPVRLQTRQLGRHNAANMLLALGIALALDLDPQRSARAISDAPRVPGRLEPVTDGDVTVLVDYAHTPDALDHALTAAKTLTDARIVCVFGCGGARDPKKRAPMGEVAGRGADLVVVTNDNPRNEDPNAIADAIRSGVSRTNTRCIVELDRARAIEAALELAQPGDVVLVAGKGHETTQEIDGQSIPFDDRGVVEHLFTRRERTTSAK